MFGRKIIRINYNGIDISKEYIKDAENRLKNYLNDKKIVDKEISKHIVDKTFADRKNNNGNTGKYRNGRLPSQSKLL